MKTDNKRKQISWVKQHIKNPERIIQEIKRNKNMNQVNMKKQNKELLKDSQKIFSKYFTEEDLNYLMKKVGEIREKEKNEKEKIERESKGKESEVDKKNRLILNALWANYYINIEFGEMKIKMGERERKEERWKKIQEQNRKINKECYQRWLKEFRISPSLEIKLINPETRELLLNQTSAFMGFYYDPIIYLTEDGIIKIGEGKKKTPKEREEFLAIFFSKIIEFEAKKYASLYQLEWEDLRQIFEIELIKKRGTYDFKKGANLLTYYRLLMRHKAIDLARKKPLVMVSLEELAEKYEKEFEEKKEAPIPKELQVLPPSIESIDLTRALKKLSLKQKEAIELIYLDDLTEKEASKKMSITQQAINRLKNKGLKNLKKFMVA
jgi:RNA polymerase sigma factor (sigma-70 family)